LASNGNAADHVLRRRGCDTRGKYLPEYTAKPRRLISSSFLTICLCEFCVRGKFSKGRWLRIDAILRESIAKIAKADEPA
jgi:hypothetical protein